MATLSTTHHATGSPGIEPKWTSAKKDAIGTAYSAASRLWFTMWNGIVTELYYPTIDRPQVRDLQFLITDGKHFFHEEKRHCETIVTPLDESLGYRVINTSKDRDYAIEKTVIVDPHSASLLMEVELVSPHELSLYALCAPHLGGGGCKNNAYVAALGERKLLVANYGHTWLAIATCDGFEEASCGFVGRSDGWTDISHNLAMTNEFDHALEGNVALCGKIDLRKEKKFLLALSFGHSLNNACSNALQSLSQPFAQQKTRFVEQWQRFVHWDKELASSSGDGGVLYHASCKILMAHEDKLNPGAMIASLSIPWGEAKGDDDMGGYHLVWPRDLCNSASGMLAAGLSSVAVRSLIFLASSQMSDGGFAQNFWISGEPYWKGMQLDETSFPIVLAWRLENAGLLEQFDPIELVDGAAGFVISNGPITQQERWEEVGGFSPSTLAINIAALICAGQMFRARKSLQSAEFVESYADFLFNNLETWTVAKAGSLLAGKPKHFVRANPCSTHDDLQDVDDAQVHIANRHADEQQTFPAKDIVDAGFLELVRYGIYSAKNPLIADSVAVVDHVLKAETKHGPCWRRYNHDGYGQNDDGSAFVGQGVGRPWPLLVGERAHYELAAGNDVKNLVETFEKFASNCGTIPEQVWDMDDLPERHLYNGGPTGSAMPLAWAHAEYIKLLRSIKDGAVYDLIPAVADRYQRKTGANPSYQFWTMKWQPKQILPGQTLRLIQNEPFTLRYTTDEWASFQEIESTQVLSRVHCVDISPNQLKHSTLEFTFYFPNSHRWIGANYICGKYV